MSKFVPDECDLVMEGGVTSGIVYPSFVAGLSRRFTLRSIGGTSVGAVAAVAAAAAQFRRNRDGSKDGFDRLADIPVELQEDLDGKSRLFSLFQPCPDLRRHFGVVAASLNRGGKITKVVHASISLIVRFSLGSIFGAVVWYLSFYTSRLLLGGQASFALSLPAMVWFGVSLLSCIWLGALLEFIATGWIGLRRNRCGICPGLRESSISPPALTEWLHGLVQDIAGLASEVPLTFGNLQTSEPPIDLALMTTGVSELRAHRLPHDSRDLVFRASEFRRLFPEDIVAWMIAHSNHASHSEQTQALLDAADNGGASDHYFLPEADKLPILVAARMSLSFPVLLQAVPLFRIRESQDGSPGPSLCRVWFSDGGLTSNFPIHFFDALLPVRSTFGITLMNDFDSSKPNEERVVLPVTNNHGVSPSYLVVDEVDGLPSPFKLGMGILQTIRTWRDEALKRTPGYRDRLVQIHHSKEEGGLNLNMPTESIERMRDSGILAADKIIARFQCDDPAKSGWLNHRWVRMRSAAALLQTALRPMQAALTQQRLAPSYAEMWLVEGASAQNAYPLNRSEREAGHILWTSIIGVDAEVGGIDLSATAPRPEPALVVAPKQN
ncbi:hypothetical protein [Janthinobacterium sp. HLS12-2]|uniref:hypothetical protein n=1 Tax=Janthinobacterium sp. HLS12-2 TaxID=1259324 RepID=UPI003F1FADBD